MKTWTSWTVWIAAALMLTGCTIDRMTASKDGYNVVRVSLFQKPEIQSVEIAPDGATKIAGYKNGEDISPVVGAAVSAAVKAAKP